MATINFIPPLPGPGNRRREPSAVEGIPVAIKPFRPPSPPPQGVALFELGFRPFFLLAGLSALVLVPIWVLAYSSGTMGHLPAPAQQWHAHEMLFGFAGAVIAGFLLTAPATWTGFKMPSGKMLCGLVLLWTSGRILPFVPGLPWQVVASADVLFFPSVGFFVLQAVWKKRQWHNLLFPLILFVMAGANLVYHCEAARGGGSAIGNGVMAYLVLILMTVMGGRVIPFFIRARLPESTVKVRPFVDFLAVAGLTATGVLDLSGATSDDIAFASLTAGVIHAFRLAGWHDRRIWKEPLLWILLTAYGWMVTGLILKGAPVMGVPLNPLPVRHALMAGAIGMMCLGMMSRVILGHTGRPMKATIAMVASFWLVNIAVLIRVVGPLVWPSFYVESLSVAATCWCAAFLLFLLTCGPMLVNQGKRV